MKIEDIKEIKSVLSRLESNLDDPRIGNVLEYINQLEADKLELSKVIVELVLLIDKDNPDYECQYCESTGYSHMQGCLILRSSRREK